MILLCMHVNMLLRISPYITLLCDSSLDLIKPHILFASKLHFVRLVCSCTQAEELCPKQRTLRPIDLTDTTVSSMIGYPKVAQEQPILVSNPYHI